VEKVKTEEAKEAESESDTHDSSGERTFETGTSEELGRLLEESNADSEALFAIVYAALKDPEGFGAEDVMLTLKSLGREDVIADAQVFASEDYNPEDDGLEDAEVDELLASIDDIEEDD
jgi:hypothetical protein